MGVDPDAGSPAGLENSSIIGRLLDEVSWEGNARQYRGGGRGKENVLSAEVLYALDFLPRAQFLGRIIAGAHGADEARKLVVHEIADADLSLLPGDVTLPGAEIRVQPDAVLSSTSSYTLIEAKRIRRSRFQTDQLARELVASVHQAGDRAPLLLVILGSPPPVAVDRVPGRVSLEQAVRHRLPAVEAACHPAVRTEALAQRIPEILAWTTWSEIREALTHGRREFATARDGATATVRGLCDAAVTAIDWHK